MIVWLAVGASCYRPDMSLGQGQGWVEFTVMTLVRIQADRGRCRFKTQDGIWGPITTPLRSVSIQNSLAISSSSLGFILMGLSLLSKRTRVCPLRYGTAQQNT